MKREPRQAIAQSFAGGRIKSSARLLLQNSHQSEFLRKGGKAVVSGWRGGGQYQATQDITDDVRGGNIRAARVECLDCCGMRQFFGLEGKKFLEKSRVTRVEGGRVAIRNSGAFCNVTSAIEIGRVHAANTIHYRRRGRGIASDFWHKEDWKDGRREVAVLGFTTILGAAVLVHGRG